MGFSASKMVTHQVIAKLAFYPPKNIELNERSIQNYNIVFHNNTPMVYLKNKLKSNKHIIFCHGNATDIFSMYSYVLNLSNMFQISVVAPEYDGYLTNESPSEMGCYNAIQNAYEFLKTQNIDDDDIYIIGQSLGTGIVIDFAFKNQNFKNPIMLISPYKTLASVVLDDESCCSSIKKTLDMFETKNKIDKIEAPCKIVHGYDDELIDISHGKELFSMLKNKLEPIWLHSAGHNNILSRMNNQIYIDFLENK